MTTKPRPSGRGAKGPAPYQLALVLARDALEALDNGSQRERIQIADPRSAALRDLGRPAPMARVDIEPGARSVRATSSRYDPSSRRWRTVQATTLLSRGKREYHVRRLADMLIDALHTLI